VLQSNRERYKTVSSNLRQKEGEIKPSAAVTKLKDSTMSFLNAADVVIGIINKLITYLLTESARQNQHDSSTIYEQ
jgi:hypothetical protein